jgi:N-acyl-D-aspartate/D-glutamate deacylase
MHNLWGKADSLLAIMDQARKEGVNLTSDIYPYAFWHSTIRVLFPDRNFSDEKEAAMILKEITLPEDITLAAYEVNPAYEGKTLAAIAASENKTPARMLVELIARIEAWEKTHNDECRESIMATSMAEQDIIRLMQWPYANICSDGSSSGRHPRGYGAFTRVLSKYSREEKALSLEKAIYKMTGLAATNLSLAKRGYLRQGYYADIVLFNPDTVQDKATVEDPHALSEGIIQVWVNGAPVFTDKKPTGIYPGHVILRK